MPFDNFYEESDKAARRWRKIVGVAFLLVAGYCTIPLIISWFENRDAKIEHERVAEREQHVDALCTSLPKPEQFSFVKREPPSSGNGRTSVIFRYISERGLEEIMPTFLVWFGSNGWKRDDYTKLKFNKGNQSIFIEPADNYWGNYQILCYEQDSNSLSFEIYD